MDQTTLKGKKLNMSQIFLPTGKVVPVTVVELESAEALANADNFMDKNVVVTGRSKGKGFTGAIKRWGFRKQGETRGAKDKVRGPGAIGSQTPGRVFKGKKMAGHKGDVQVTIKGLKIVNVDPQSGCLMVSGPIPGARNSQVTLKVEGLSLEDLKSEKADEGNSEGEVKVEEKKTEETKSEEAKEKSEKESKDEAESVSKKESAKDEGGEVAKSEKTSKGEEQPKETKKEKDKKDKPEKTDDSGKQEEE